MIFKFIPVLTIWTVIVIFFLYKSLRNVTIDNPEDVDKLSNIRGLNDQLFEVSDRSSEGNQLLIQRHDSSATDKINLPETTRIPTKNEQAPLSIENSREDFLRKGRVFILLIQSEDLKTFTPHKTFNIINHRTINPSNQAKDGHFHGTEIPLPDHIKYLVNILDSHRIEHVIDTTRSGLPKLLLADPYSSNGNKHYSVLVIDDFIKYTRLNRWVRDQLDRHCRANHIGVITFLNDHELEHNDQLGGLSGHRIIRAGELHRSQPPLKIQESVAYRFPLRFKLLKVPRACQDSGTISRCRVEYQLNESSPILRILKRRPNFIIDGPPISDLLRDLRVTMSSNHITYEPLIRARFKIIRRSKASRDAAHVFTKFRENIQKIHRNDHSATTMDLNMFSHANLTKLSERNRIRDNFESQIASDDAHLPGSDLHEDFDTTDSASKPLSAEHDPPILSMFDRGLYDGIKRVILGGTKRHWLNRVILLDAIEHLSTGTILSPLKRYIQIDIDDIFLGESGTRMNKSDVEALIENQRNFASHISGGFKFNLGYSGKYFKQGTEVENMGDDQLVASAHKFTWFCHTWSHSKAHLHIDIESIDQELKRNADFANAHGLPIIGRESQTFIKAPTYAVAPHHSGVYPVHEQLYESWRNVLNVQVTSTEEYPALRLASSRRAFVHRAIKVLPRQTCGLYTHTIYKDKYPGGPDKLDAIIKGGELFETLLHNPVNIYMTHMSNYANDRLALYTFNALLEFVQLNTNLQLTYAPSQQNQLGPAKLAQYYFSLFPKEEASPLWTNPCIDKRHLTIWAPAKHIYCKVIPKLLIVGPQKTGTTALYSFLKMNPIFKSSIQSNIDFEEIQFFNDKYYSMGLDWYLKRFDHERQNSSIFSDIQDRSIYFDKSATYFDDPRVPGRAASLLPSAYIVVILVNPSDRAYSWYQHMKAHGDTEAKDLSFEQVIMANEVDIQKRPALRLLRNRCLHPGYYSQHLARWFQHYPPHQIIIIDGLWFRQSPADVMNKLQRALKIESAMDYENLLSYNHEKGFFCQQDSQARIGTKCLGASKGRKYEPMSSKAREFLNLHYLAHNQQLAKVMSDIGQPLPTWLEEMVSISSIFT